MAKELTYKEFEDKIKDISPEIYMTYKEFGFICLSFGNNLLLRVSLIDMYDIDVINKNFAGFEKVYQLASVLTSTPICDRGDIEDINTPCNLWNVIISNDGENGQFSYIAWNRDYHVVPVSHTQLMINRDYQFSDGEFLDLINYLKFLPDGNKQSEIAKLGKTPVEDK